MCIRSVLISSPLRSFPKRLSFFLAVCGRLYLCMTNIWTLSKAAVISNASLLSSVDNVTLTCCAAGQWSQIEVCLASAPNLTHNTTKPLCNSFYLDYSRLREKGWFLVVFIYVNEQTWCKIIGLFPPFGPCRIACLLYVFLKCLQHALAFCMLLAQRWTVNNVWQHVWQHSAAGYMALMLGSTLRDPHIFTTSSLGEKSSVHENRGSPWK